jgi:hypothetical protein
MAADFSKIINHPDKQNIITKITTGESPKNISLHLKSKYDQPDEKHLALSESLLKSFADNYLNVDQRIKKVLKNDIDNKLDRKIADSLLDNKTYKERVAEVATQELDIKRKVHNILHILECRAEQIFDLIQSNPESTKADYIFTKYMEIIGMNLEKADKIINGKPDIKVEHTYTIQMVEQTSNVFQETIRRVLDKMDPTFSSLFMDLLAEEMTKAKGELPQTVIKSSFEDAKSLDKSVAKIEKIDKLLEKEYGQIIEDDGSSGCDITEDFEEGEDE